MSKKWRFKSGSDTLVVVRRADLFPEEQPTYDHLRLVANLDAWLKDPLARQALFELDETLHGRSRTAPGQAGDVAAMIGAVKTRLTEAFKRRTAVGVLVPRSFLTQAPFDEATDGAPAPAGPPPRPGTIKQTAWIEIELVDDQNKPVPNERYRVEVPDGTFKEGNLDTQGRARIDGIDPGQCEISFPDLDASEWAAAK